MKLTRWSVARKKHFVDPRIKVAYDALAPEFAIIDATIQRRLAKKMTQNALAKKIGTTQSAIARLESGTYNPTLGFLKKVAKGLDAQLLITIK